MSTKTLTLEYKDLIRYERNRTKNPIDETIEDHYIRYNGSGKVGVDDGEYATATSRVWCDLSSVWDDAITAQNLLSAELRIVHSDNNPNNYALYIKAVAFGGVTGVGSENEVGYDACGLGDQIGETIHVLGSDQTWTEKIQLDSGTWKTLAENKAIGIIPTREAEFDGIIAASASVERIELHINYTDDMAKPIIRNMALTSPAASNNKIPYTDDLTVTWEYSHETLVPQSFYQVQMWDATNSWYTVAEAHSSVGSITIAPDKFPNPYGMIGLTTYVRVRCMSSMLVYSDWVENTITLVFPTTYDLNPGNGETRLGDTNIDLEWKAKTEYDGHTLIPYVAPSLFDLQYSLDSGEIWTDLVQAHAAKESEGIYTYSVPANTFAPGLILWRVRARVGERALLNVWGTGRITVKVQASTSSVTSDGKPHPTVRWSSSSQIAYQVRFADYDSSAIYGSATSHAIPYVYSDGIYPVQVRTQASDGTWSDWTETEYVTITNTPQSGLLRLIAAKTRHTVNLKWQVIAGWDTYILYRNDIPIYVGNAKEYTDTAAVGVCRYYVRGMAEPNYAQSNSVEINANPAVDCMYDLMEQRWIPLRYSSTVRTRSYSETVNAVYRYYAGRRYPVAFVDGTRERSLNVSYCFKTLADADTVREALGHQVIYKDTMGRRIVGLFGGMAETVTRRFEHALTIIETDYSEEVRYEP